MKKGYFIFLIIFVVIVITAIIAISWISYCSPQRFATEEDCNKSILCHGRTTYGGGGLQSEIRACLPFFIPLK